MRTVLAVCPFSSYAVIVIAKIPGSKKFAKKVQFVRSSDCIGRLLELPSMFDHDMTTRVAGAVVWAWISALTSAKETYL